MSRLDRLWAAWRSDYVTGVTSDREPRENERECVFCAILEGERPDQEGNIVFRGEYCVVILNAYPYTSGHVLVMPNRHVSDLDQLNEAEGAELWSLLTKSVTALKTAYSPEGVNVGANIGRAAGAGIPAHLHLHALPRWIGDTNFMTSVAEVRVMPESLGVSLQRLRDAWPA